MTHSGQGDESRPPASRPAHEGVVLPADGSEPFIPGVSAQRVAPAGGTPWGAPWGPGQEAQPLPQEEPPGAGAPYAQPVSARTLPPQVPQHAQTPYGYGQTAAQAPGPDADATQFIAPVPPGSGDATQYDAPPHLGHGGAAGPAGPDADATQFIAPVPPGSGDATQFIAPVPPGSGDATQYIAPARPGPGALPPESPAGAAPFPGAGPAGAVPGVPAGDGEATQYLPPVADPNASRQQTPAPPPGAPYGIRPGAPGDRQPPAEFDNLFRSDAGAGGGAEATQHLPPVREPGYGAQSPHTSHASHASQGRRAARRSAESRPSPRNSSRDSARNSSRNSARLPLIAAVVVGCAVLGLGASALMFGGGGDDPQSANTGVAAATSPATGAAGEAAEDPVRAQAVELDKLLADSNDSRAAVIRSVESIKTCQNLDQAAADLRGAAEQRRGLVTRLQGLSVDELPDNQALTASLRKAWEASASADDHYAAWAGQVGEKKGCKGGKARSTGQTAQGNAQSGVATKAKREAATIWNRIAAKHGLTERSAEQL
ncbi:hypothetical protein [Streptomyces sp. PKU-MA01144]|uniref:hypothetical protein n=1 Tax=Streptomyces sp. PKU-MA01144 TaxID=2729138 RepID=UPI0028117B54|nr:hypothetical protein [Streptomyces sp. PKU-MA01144]